MKRFTVSLLVFAALAFTMVGCKRSSDENKRKPIRVSAGDWINPQATDDTATAYPKKDRNAPPGPAEEKKARERRTSMLENIAKTYKSYFDTRTLPELNEGDFKLRLTRDTFAKERKAVEGDVFKIVYEADAAFGDHIVAYSTEPDEQNKHESALVNLTIERIKGGDLPNFLQKQAVQCVYSQFKAYIALGQPRTFEQFQSYLKENASASVARMVGSQDIRVNMNAQVGNGGSILACYKAPNGNLGASPRAVMGVMGNGETRPLEPDAVQQVFAK